MGPAAWAAVGRAILTATTGQVIFGSKGLARLAFEEVSRAILEREFELAEVMIRDLRRKHRDAYDAFIEEYGSELPEEFLHQS